MTTTVKKYFAKIWQISYEPSSNMQIRVFVFNGKLCISYSSICILFVWDLSSSMPNIAATLTPAALFRRRQRPHKTVMISGNTDGGDYRQSDQRVQRGVRDRSGDPNSGKSSMIFLKLVLLTSVESHFGTEGSQNVCRCGILSAAARFIG